MLIFCMTAGATAWSQGHKLSETEIRRASNVDADIDSNLPVTIQRAPKQSRIADHYIVLFKSAVADPEFEARDIEVHTGGNVHHTYTHAVKGFAATLAPEAVENLRHDPRVAMIEEERLVQPTAMMPMTQLPLPASPQFPTPTWALDRIDQRTLPLDNSFSFPSNAGAGVHIYMLDSGIMGGINGLGGAHVEFEGRVGNGFDANTPGGDASDCIGHGTFGASLAAGTTLGVAKLATLHPVRIICGGGSAEAIAGVNWITGEQLAHPGQKSVANASFLILGGPDPALDLAVQNSINAGVVYVVAAGNQGPADTHFDFITGLDLANACNTSPQRVGAALTVGAMGGRDFAALPTSVLDPITDTIPDFSDTGSCVDLYAPGVGMTGASITSTTAISGPPTFHFGTSWSAPMTTGVAALFLAANPNANPSQVAAAINGNATLNALAIAEPGFGGPNRLLYSDFQTDIQTTVSSNQGAPAVGLIFTYTFQVHNNGPYNTMDSVLFTDTLPSGISVANSIAPGVPSITTSRGSCSGNATITCDLGRLAVGDSAVIVITVLATTPGTYTNAGTAVLQSGQTDRAPANNGASVTLTSK